MLSKSTDAIAGVTLKLAHTAKCPKSEVTIFIVLLGLMCLAITAAVHA